MNNRPFILLLGLTLALALTLALTATHAAPCADSKTEPDTPNYSFDLSGSRAVLSVEFDRRTSSPAAGFTTFEILFGGDNSCDFTAPLDGFAPSPANDWSFSSLTSGCTANYTMDAPITKLIGRCGFVRDETREPGRVHFINRNITISTTQTRTDLRSPYVATRETGFTIDISIASNVTASSQDVQVFGNALQFSLLGAFRVEVIDNSEANNPNVPYVYQVSGTAVTSVQEPYVLEYKTGSASVEPVSDFDYLTFEASPNTTCPEAAACTQEWTFAVNLSSLLACNPETENGFTQLTDQRLNVSFEVGCSDSFQGECAPEFDDLTGLSLALTSSNFCPKFETLELNAEVVPYAFGLQSDDSAIPSAAQQWAIERFSTTSGKSQTTQNVYSAYRVESIFTYESTIYLEARAWVVNQAATIATAALTRITTKPTGKTAIDVYRDEDNSGTQNVGDLVAPDSDLVVANTGFGDDTQDYDHSRARAQFELNQNTYDRSATGDPALDDAAQSGTIEVNIAVTFAEPDQTSAFGSDEQYLLVASLLADTGERGTTTRIGFRDAPPSVGDGDSAGPAAPGTSGASGSASGSSVVAVAGVSVAGVALVALVAAVVLRRRGRPAKPVSSDLNTAPQTSSSADVMVLNSVPLEVVRASYAGAGGEQQV